MQQWIKATSLNPAYTTPVCLFTVVIGFKAKEKPGAPLKNPSSIDPPFRLYINNQPSIVVFTSVSNLLRVESIAFLQVVKLQYMHV